VAKTRTTVSFTLPIKLLALLDDEAKKRGVSRSRLLTVAIMNELEIPMEQQVELALGLG
jgi:metal-responsive CopG/Arc/MetJ family transcriptional regulator